MEQYKEILYGGVTTTPDDYLCQDGELQSCVGLLDDGSGMHTIDPGKTLFNTGSAHILWIHEQPTYKNIICYIKDNATYLYNIYAVDLALYTAANAQSQVTLSSYILSNNITRIKQLSLQPTQAISMGNVVTIICVHDDTNSRDRIDMIHRDDNVSANGSADYVLLGNSLPGLDMHFKLVGDYKTTSKFQFIKKSENSEKKYKIVNSFTLNGRFDSSNNHRSQTFNLSQYNIPNGSRILVRITANVTNKLHGKIYFLASSTEASQTAKFLSSDANRQPNNVWWIDEIVKTQYNINAQTVGGFGNTKFGTSNLDSIYFRYPEYDTDFDFTAIVQVFEQYDSVLLDNSKDNYYAVISKVNEYIYNATQDNKFVYPFFVRYAYKLFDGSYYYPSAPMLMIPNKGRVPFCWLFDETNQTGDMSLSISAIQADLKYAFLDPDQLVAAKSKYKDIIKSVVIAVSQPIMSYNQAKEWVENSVNLESENLSYIESAGKDISICQVPAKDGVYNYNQWDLFFYYATNYATGKNKNNTTIDMLKLPKFSAEEQRNNLEQLGGVFYIVKEILLDDIDTDKLEEDLFEDPWYDVKLDDYTLSTLGTQSTLDDSYWTLNKHLPSVMSVYNRRMIYADSYEQIFAGYSPTQMMGACGNIDPVAESSYFYYVESTISDGTQIHKAIRPIGNHFTSSPLLWFYYPNSLIQSARVYRVYINWRDGGEHYDYGGCAYADINLRQHSVLSGKYMYCEIEDLIFHPCQYPSNLNAASSPTFYYKNRIIQSKAYNPFVFDNKLTSFVGNERIMSIIPANISLSTDQSGRLPIVAFTGDGIWTMDINADGSIQPAQPASRDVCLSQHAICSIDNGIVFASDRGIMIMVGQQIACLTESVYNGIDVSYNDPDEKKSRIDHNFKQFTMNCHVSYDYTHQRILVYDKTGADTRTFVYSLVTKKWSIALMSLLYPVNSYPECVVVDKDGYVRDLSLNNKTITISAQSDQDDSSTEDLTDVTINTRPFCLDDSNSFKTIDFVRQNGVYKLTHIKHLYLYGSNDLVHWFKIGEYAGYRSSGTSGTGYRFFRFKLEAELSDTDRIDSFIVGYHVNDENRYLY